MSEPLVLDFENFKRLSDNKRIYYYVGEDSYEFVFLVDGIFIKTSILKTTISNSQQFFSDKMFYGAMELKFRIPNPKTDIEEIEGIKSILKEPIIIQEEQTEESKQIDYQVEGSK